MDNYFETYNKSSILVTGGAGFIGSHIVDELIKQGNQVIIADNLTSGKSENINSQSKFYNVDILSDDFEKIFKENNINIVIHLAAQVSVSNSQKDPFHDASININGSLNVLKMCKKYGVEKIVAASTAAVYGEPNYLPIDELHNTNPTSCYGLSKLSMEKYIQLSGVKYLICRFSNVYGERQNVYGEAGVVTIFDNAMKNNLPVTIFGNGEQVRDFIYVKDIAKITHQMLISNIENEIVNISTNEGITINELFEALKHKYNYSLEPIYKEARSGDIDVSILSNKKLVSLIGEYDFCNNLKGEKIKT